MRYSTFTFATLFVAAAAPALAVPVNLWTRFDELEARHDLPYEDPGPVVHVPRPPTPPPRIHVPANVGPPPPRPPRLPARPGGHTRRAYHDEELFARMDEGLYDELFGRA
ncbi:uncharacterized protein B0H18DRAFT_1002610 [Fomitopsis serialis]|uniref:uncharacterized protein n=1 Tax=Fomitopsis serialis TaxID=139415 RepID=UPI002008E4D2|nr:uncharacterized protein B0H18DRAFT_1002610 [Neoantrodia serialis]KAH9927584.1 hypothetical protein B0H18DRAFT_1002610 [Neoantrodia serialis]